MTTATITDQMDQLRSNTIIKEEQNQFNSDAEDEEIDKKSHGGQNTLNNIKKEEGECYNESINVIYLSEKKDGSGTLLVKEEFQNEKEEKMCENAKNLNVVIKYEFDGGLHSELVIKKEELNSNDETISIDNEDRNELDSDSACSSSQDETTDNLTGNEDEPCKTETRELSTKVIFCLNESDTNESVNTLEEENEPKNYKKTHNKDKPFKCIECNKTSRKLRLLEHSYIHTGEKPFKCDKCEKTFSRKQHLLAHTFTHTGEKPFKCNKCEKSFVCKTNFKNHALIHIGTAPFKCDKCKKIFLTKQYLIQHTFMHTGEKSFKCDNCEKTFSTKQKLTQHTFIHTGDKPFKCEICEKSFVYKTQLKTHALIHTGESPFKCDKCKKIFTRIQHLKEHTLTHSEEKPFKCDKCKKTFIRKQYLIEHTVIHTGKKPFKCDKCEKTFTWRGSVNRHNKKVHDI